MRKIKLLLAVGVALTTQTLFAQVPSYVPTNGLVGYWPFSGNANDASGNGNNGVVNGATLTADRFGNLDKSYSFANSETIEIASQPSLNISENYSIALWYLTTADTYPAQDIMIKGINDYTGQACYLRHCSSTFATPTFSYVSGAQMPYTGLTTTLPPINTWHFIVININNSQADLYIDNNLTNSILFPNLDNMLNNSSLKIGGGYYNFNGKIDDVGFWNRALTQQEITNLYNANQCLTNITVTDTLIINVGQLSFNAPVTWANNITISPNPASSQININFNNITNLNGGTLKIINSLGQEVATTPITTSGTNSTMQLATWGGTGMYFVQIINPQGQIVDIKKIILQ